MGNLRLVPQFLLASTGQRIGIDLSLLAGLSLPIGDDASFQGESFHAEPKLAMDIRLGRPTVEWSSMWWSKTRTAPSSLETAFPC